MEDQAPLNELAKIYDPQQIEKPITQRWLDHKAFAANPDERDQRYVIMMPLPNVTGALHMGHAMDNVMQDLLSRWHRMQGKNTLWMAGTDHAGIATQAVVEKRLLELEGKTRQDIGRDKLVQRIWDWKDEYQARIVAQQQAMGCSCDWDRQRFTMDEVCARAVRHTFFKMFKDGLIYRGDRLVNWDCSLQTAVSDDELYKATVQGHFWHLHYPVIDPKPSEPSFIVVATTRPETMLGDTAVACHPDPQSALAELMALAKDKGDQEECQRLEARRDSHLAQLETIAAMAKDGRQVMLPLQERPIPIICDAWAKPDLGSGCVKITPAHDPNDYEVWQRHKEQIDIINILNTDGSLNANAGKYRGEDRFAARKLVVGDLESAGLLQGIEDREIEVDHSDRSKSIIEPYVSREWFVNMADVEGGVCMAQGTDKEFRSPGLAQAAIDAADPAWQSQTGMQLQFFPDADRYGNYYRNWLGEKRDWCISRQLWWGHRIPVWTGTLQRQDILQQETSLTPFMSMEGVACWIVTTDGRILDAEAGIALMKEDQSIFEVEVQVCFLDAQQDENMGDILRMGGLNLDPDVLDTWFSSALWPHSTLGWPDPATAAINKGQAPLGSQDGAADCLSYFYPGSCLVTGRDIITLWVARMVIMGLYNVGDLPFRHVFIHANIQDGKGNKMSKSSGNGIDPVDIINKYGADAMRYVVCELQTGTQDVRLPVHAISPFTGKTVELAKAKHGRTIFTYLCPETGKEFDVLGTMPDVPAAQLFSERFDVGRGFCNKLWNAARFALMNLGEVGFQTLDAKELPTEDRWILSRLHAACIQIQQQLTEYSPAAAISAARKFFWDELCDWYLEMIKPRMRQEDPVAGQVLAATMDQCLRLLHPFLPFITEALWERLNAQAPQRGIDKTLPSSDLLVQARWPEARSHWQDTALEAEITEVQEIIQSIRNVRASNDTPMSKALDVMIKTGRQDLARHSGLISHMANLQSLHFAADLDKPKTAATMLIKDMEIFVLGVVDVAKEQAKLEKQRDKLQKQMLGLEKRLGNPGFLDKAPAQVVAKEQANLQEMQTQLQNLEISLADLEES